MMYDLFRASKANRTEQVFVMRAPLSTVSEFLSLHLTAQRRVVEELKAGGQVVELYDSRRYPDQVYLVTEAVGTR